MHWSLANKSKRQNHPCRGLLCFFGRVQPIYFLYLWKRRFWIWDHWLATSIINGLPAISIVVKCVVDCFIRDNNLINWTKIKKLRSLEFKLNSFDLGKFIDIHILQPAASDRYRTTANYISCCSLCPALVVRFCSGLRCHIVGSEHAYPSLIFYC